MAATLDKGILDAIMTGNSSIRMIPRVDAITDTSFDEADEIFTVEGTLSIEQAEPTSNPINLDQTDLPAKTIYTAGEYALSADVPSVATEMLEYFYDPATTQPTLTTGITGADGTTKYKNPKGFFAQPKRKSVTMLLEDRDKQNALVLMNVDLVASQSFTNVKTSAFVIRLTGSVLTNPTAGAPDFVVLKADGVEAASLQTMSNTKKI